MNIYFRFFLVMLMFSSSPVWANVNKRIDLGVLTTWDAQINYYPNDPKSSYGQVEVYSHDPSIFAGYDLISSTKTICNLIRDDRRLSVSEPNASYVEYVGVWEPDGIGILTARIDLYNCEVSNLMRMRGADQDLGGSMAQILGQRQAEPNREDGTVGALDNQYIIGEWEVDTGLNYVISQHFSNGAVTNYNWSGQFSGQPTASFTVGWRVENQSGRSFIVYSRGDEIQTTEIVSADIDTMIQHVAGKKLTLRRSNRDRCELISDNVAYLYGVLSYPRKYFSNLDSYQKNIKYIAAITNLQSDLLNERIYLLIDPLIEGAIDISGFFLRGHFKIIPEAISTYKSLVDNMDERLQSAIKLDKRLEDHGLAELSKITFRQNDEWIKNLQFADDYMKDLRNKATYYACLRFDFRDGNIPSMPERPQLDFAWLNSSETESWSDKAKATTPPNPTEGILNNRPDFSFGGTD